MSEWFYCIDWERDGGVKRSHTNPIIGNFIGTAYLTPAKAAQSLYFWCRGSLAQNLVFH